MNEFSENSEAVPEDKSDQSKIPDQTSASSVELTHQQGLLAKVTTRFRNNVSKVTRTRKKPASQTERKPPPPVIIEKSNNRLLQYSPFTAGFFGAVGVISATALFGAISQVQHVIILAIMSLFLALGLSPAVEWLTQYTSRALAVAIVTVSVLAIVLGGFWSLVPIATEQIQRISDNIPFWLNNLLKNPQFAQWDADYRILGKINDFLSSDKLLEQAFGGILGAGKILANVVFSIIMTLVLTIYFLASLPAIKHFIYHLAPASRRARTKYLANEIFRGISGYLVGMFVVVTIAATSSFIFMQFAGLKDYSLALAFVVALFCFIPLIGSSLAMFAVALVGFGVSPMTGLAVIIYFLIYQQFDAYFIYPKVMGKTVRVPGVLVVLSALIGGILFGVIGALIAIPSAAALLLLYREVLLPHLDNK
ncbi:MAG: AI-2E family transporter [Propionibacterium sp.]|nr:MAG: AI-2E family transporter [Propionibacterium sp.]